MISSQDNNERDVHNRPTSSDVAKVIKMTSLPTAMMIEIFGWLDQYNLMEMSLVSKQINSIVKNGPGNKSMISPVFEVRCKRSNERDFFRKLHNLFSNQETTTKLQSYVVFRLVDCSSKMNQISNYEIGLILKCVQRRNRFTALELISTKRQYHVSFKSEYLPKMLPNLTTIYLSDVNLFYIGVGNYPLCCPLLEKVTFHNCARFFITFSGFTLRNANNLKEIIISGTVFIDLNMLESWARMWDLDDHQTIFLFHRCCKNLERVSFKNVKWPYDVLVGFSPQIVQKMLVKFVRQAPSTLRWFQSELSPENMTMLRLERPGIILLN